MYWELHAFLRARVNRGMYNVPLLSRCAWCLFQMSVRNAVQFRRGDKYLSEPVCKVLSFSIATSSRISTKSITTSVKHSSNNLPNHHHHHETHYLVRRSRHYRPRSCCGRPCSDGKSTPCLWEAGVEIGV